MDTQTIEVEWTLHPVSTTSKYGTPMNRKEKIYYEQIIIKQDDYPIALTHIDTFWAPNYDTTIHDRLTNGEKVTVLVKISVEG